MPIGKWLLWTAGLGLAVVLVVYGVPLVERLLDKGDAPAAGDSLSLPLDSGDVAGAPESIELPSPGEVGDPDTELDAVMQAVDERDEAEATDTPAAEPQSEAMAEPVEPVTPAAVPEKPPATEAAVATGPATITLRFREDSWVEMESRGRKLVVGIQAAGSERTVRAEPPVSILLGNAPGVVVRYRGERVDLEPHQRGKVARLVLED